MYQAYYGFSEKPFALSPDPKFLFLSQTHREVLGHLIYGIEQGEGFMAISGEVGTGKTTLCRTLLERLGECEIAFLFNPTLTPTDLIKAINSEFGLSTFGDSRAELIDVLNTHLLDAHAEGRRVLVIIDEAQNLPDETLEQLRLLGNLESRTEKLLQILLIGQPELDTKLEARQLRQLRQRISVWWRLGSLLPHETAGYIRHRLRVASGTDRPYFTDAALARIHKVTGGVPRLINVVADRSLLAGFGHELDEIPDELVQGVASELRSRPTRRQVRRRALGLGVAGAALAAGLAWAFSPAALPPASPPSGALTSVEAPSPDETVAGSIAQRRGELPPVSATLQTPPLPIPIPEIEPEPLRPDAAELDRLLGALSPGDARRLSVVAMLQAWRRTAAVGNRVSSRDIVRILRSNALTPIQLEEPEHALARDVPAIVLLATTAGAPRAALALRIEGDHVLLDGLAPGRLVQISLDVLRERWIGPAWAATTDTNEPSAPKLHVAPSAQSSTSPASRTILARE